MNPYSRRLANISNPYVCCPHPGVQGPQGSAGYNGINGINELMKLISQNFGCKLRLFKLPLLLLLIIFYFLNKKSQFDRINSSLVVDASATKRLLNWSPPFTLKEGLKITTNAFLQK